MSFNINAKVVLSGPERLDKIRNSIKKKLGNLNVPLTIDVGKGTQSALSNLNSQTQALQKSMAALQAATKNVNNSYNKYNKSSKGASTSNKNLAQATNAVSNSFDRTAKSAQQAGSQVEKFGKDAALAIRRFSAFTLATGAVFGFVQSVRTGISESIAFERQLSRITQVTGKTGNSIKKLGSDIQALASNFGVSKSEIAEVAVILAQTGRSIEDIQKSLKPLTQTQLGPTFKDLKSTTEGLIAAQAQFGIKSKDTVKILDSLNAIAKRFAVESDDLVSVIRRAGGVFAEANKNAKLFAQGSGVVTDSVDDQIQSFNELLGIFTSVRSQTRETADTISTGLRTIFSRLQRPTTIKFLEQYGVQLKVTEQDVKDFQNTAKGDLISQDKLKALRDSVGDFVGVSEAIRRIGKAAGGLNNLELSKLVEELGGIRQVGKIIPALRNVDKAVQATNIGIEGTGSVANDAVIAVQTLDVRLSKLSESFKNVTDSFFQSDTLKGLTSGILSIAEGLVAAADAAKPLIPLLTTIVGTSLTKAGFSFFKGFKKEFSNATGGISGSVGSKLGGSLSSSSSSSSSSSKATTRVDPALLNATRDNTKALRELTAILRDCCNGKKGSGGGGDSKGGPSGGSGGKRGPKGGSGGGGRGSGGDDSGPILDATLVDPRLPLPRGAKQFDLRGGVTSLPPKKGSSISPVKPNPNFDIGGQIAKEAKNKSDSNLQRLFNFKPNSVKTAANELERFQKELDDLGKELSSAQKDVSGFAFGITNLKKGGALASTATTQGLDNFITQGDITSSVNSRGKGKKGGIGFEPAVPTSRVPGSPLLAPVGKILKSSRRQTPQEKLASLEKRGEGDRIITVEVAGGKLDKIDNISKGGVRDGVSIGPIPKRPRGKDIPTLYDDLLPPPGVPDLNNDDWLRAMDRINNPGRLVSQEEYRTTELKQFSNLNNSPAIKALGNVGKGKAIGANENSIIVANKELTDLNATLKGTDTVTINTEKALERARGANGRFVGGLQGLKGTFVQLEATVQKSQATLGNATVGIISKDDGGRSRAPAGTTLASGKKIGGRLLPQNNLDATLNPTIDKAAASAAEFSVSVDSTTTAFNENNQAVDKNTTEHELLEKSLLTYRQSMDKVTKSAEEAARRLATIQAAKSKAPRSNKFAKGGFVDGPSHSQGGVPAELEGGEFVVPKAQVDQKKKLPKFAAGDLFKEGDRNPENKDKIVIQDSKPFGLGFIQGPKDKDVTGGLVATEKGISLVGAKGQKKGLDNVSKALKKVNYPVEEKGIPTGSESVIVKGPYGKYALAPPNTEDLDQQGILNLFKEEAPQAALEAGFGSAFAKIANSVDSSILNGEVPSLENLPQESQERFKTDTYVAMKGFMVEAFASALSGAQLAKEGSNFDIEGVTAEQRKKLSLYYSANNKKISGPPIDTQDTTFLEAKSGAKQIENAAPKFSKGYANGQLEGSYKVLAKGGLTGEANSLLMPGELVFPPDLVAKVGIEKLREFNKNGDPSVLGNVSGKGIGTVPGTGNTDNFPADLESGSFVVKKSSSKKSGLQKFAGGGLTGTSISGVERTGSGKRVVRDAEGEIVSFGSALAGLTESALSVGVVFNSLSSIDFSSTQGLATAIPTIAFGFNSLKPIISQAGPLLKGLGREFGLISEQTQKSNKGLDDFTKALNQASTRLYDTGSGEDFFDNFKRKTKIGGKDFDVSPRQQRSIERVNRAQERKKLTRQQRIDRVNRQRGFRFKDPLAEGRVGKRKGLTSKSFLTKGFGLGAGFQDASLGKAGFNFGTFAQKAFSRGLKGGAIGAGIGAAISTGIEKVEFFGSSREIAGVKGLTSGSVEDAGLQGAIQGATQFGSTLAGIGSAFGPFGTAIGGATGAIIGWTKGLLEAEEEQKKFNIFKGIEDDSKGFQLALDELAKTIANKEGAAAINESISQVGKRSKELAGQIGVATASLEDFNIDTDKTATTASVDILKDFLTGEFSQAASGLNKKLNNIESIITLDPRGVITGLTEAIGENSLLGPFRDFIDRQSGRETTRSEDTRALVSNVQNFDNLVQALSVFDSQSLKQAEDQLFKSIPDIIAKSITDQQGLENQEEAIKRLEALDKALINSTGFDDTIEAIEKFNKEAKELGEESVIDEKLIESLKGIQKASQQQDIKEFAESIEKLKDAKKIKSQIGDPLVELAKQLSKPDSNVENAAEAFKQEFLEAINLKSLSRQGLNFETEEGLINVEDFFNTRDIEKSLKFLKESISIDKEKELGPEKFKANLEIIGKLFGGSADNASLLVVQLLDLFESLDQGNASAISAATAQTLLSLATEKSVEGIRVFTSALNELSNSVSSSVEKLGVAASNTQAEVERILSGSSEVRPDERFNPFASPGASNKDILAGADRLKSAFGGLESRLGEGGFQGLGAASIFSGDLSKILKDTANQVRGELAQSKTSTLGENQILDAFKDNAGDVFSKLPSEIQKRFLDRLQETFRGSRQEKGASSQELLEQLVQFGDVAGLDEFGEEVKAALADLTNSLNQFETLVVQSANIALEAAKKEADTKSKLLNREISLQRRLDKFTNSSINKRKRAEDNLRANLENTASVGGTVGLGNTDVLDARSLAKRQERLEAERDRLRKQIGLGDDATPGQIEKATRGANQPLIKQLGENAAALEGNRKALEALGEDVTRLEAVESELSKIQESRLDQRQRAKLFADRISSAKTPQEQVKVFNEFLKPVIAASKAAQGVALNFGEAASIIGDPKIIQDALGLNDQQLEKLLASATGGIGGAFGRLFGRLGGNFNLGGQLGGRLFGTGATELGTTEKEIELKKQLIDLDSDSRKAILETNKLIQAALLETQEKFADKVSVTAQALDEAGDKFEKLTEKLKVLVPQLQAGGNPPTRQTGGRITGPSHSNGGVDIEAEGGEFIIRKSATSKLQKQMPGLLESLNKGKIPRKMPHGGPTDEEEFNFRKPKGTPRVVLDRNPIGTVNNAPTLSDLKSLIADDGFINPGNVTSDATSAYSLVESLFEYITSGPVGSFAKSQATGAAVVADKVPDLAFDATLAPVLEKVITPVGKTIENAGSEIINNAGSAIQSKPGGAILDQIPILSTINNIDSAIQSKPGDAINDFFDPQLDSFGNNIFRASNAINPLGDDNAIESTIFKKGRKEVANSVEKFYGDVVGGLFSGGNVSKEQLLKRSVEQSKEFEGSRPDPNRARIGSINERNPDGLALRSVSGKEQASKPSQTSVQFGSNVLTDKELAQFNPNTESRELGERTKQLTSIADEGLLGGIVRAEQNVTNALKATGKALIAGFDTGEFVDRDAEFQNSLKVEEERIRRNKKAEKENPNAFRARLLEKNIFDSQGNLALRNGDTGFDDGSGSRRGNRLNTTGSKLAGIRGIQSPTAFRNTGGRADQPNSREAGTNTDIPFSNFIGNQFGDLDIIERMRNSSFFGVDPEENRQFNDVQSLQSSLQKQQIRDFRRTYNNERGEFDGLQAGVSLAPKLSPFENLDGPNERNLNFPDDVNRDRLLQGLPADSFVAQNRIDYLRQNNITDPNADISNEEIIANEKAKRERLKKAREARIAKEKETAAKKKADAEAKKKQYEDTINPLQRSTEETQARIDRFNENRFSNVGGVNLNELSSEELSKRGEKIANRKADPRFSEETLARERANLDDFIEGRITEEQFQATRKPGATEQDDLKNLFDNASLLLNEDKVATDTTKKSKPTTSKESASPPVPEKPVGPVQPDRLSPEEEKASLQRMADSEAQFFGGNNIRPNAKVSEQEQAKLRKKAEDGQQFFGTNSIRPNAKVSEQEQAKLRKKAKDGQQFFGTNSIKPSDPVSQQRQARLVELEGGGAQFVGAGLSKSDPEKRAAARARRKAQLQERKDAALKGVRGAFRKQQGGTLGQEVQSIDARGQNQPTGRGSTGNPLLDKFRQGIPGGTRLQSLPDITTGGNFTSSAVGDEQRAAAFEQSLSSGGADGIARPGQFPPQDLSSGGADGIALANQTPPVNLTQLEGNRNARAQAGGATIENNQQFVTVAQELTTASETFSQSIANSVQLLNESPFIQQLTKASEVLSSLPEMKITLNAQVKPVEVILNGGALIAQMKEEAKAEILQAVGEKIANLTNPDGSIRNDSLS